jgi:hypothetical protein
MLSQKVLSSYMYQAKYMLAAQLGQEQKKSYLLI